MSITATIYYTDSECFFGTLVLYGPQVSLSECNGNRFHRCAAAAATDNFPSSMYTREVCVGDANASAAGQFFNHVPSGVPYVQAPLSVNATGLNVPKGLGAFLLNNCTILPGSIGGGSLRAFLANSGDRGQVVTHEQVVVALYSSNNCSEWTLKDEASHDVTDDSIFNCLIGPDAYLCNFSIPGGLPVGQIVGFSIATVVVCAIVVYWVAQLFVKKMRGEAVKITTSAVEPST